jgi:hypothetical protein
MKTNREGPHITDALVATWHRQTHLKPFAHETVHDLPDWRAPRLTQPVAWMPVPKVGRMHRVLVHCVESNTATRGLSIG